MGAPDLPARPAEGGPGARPARDDTRHEEPGARFLLRFSALIRTAKTHDVSNQAFQRQLHDLVAVLQELFEEENEVALAAVADYFYLDGRRIKANASLLPVYHGLLGEFERRTLGGLRFLQGVHAAELERFFQLFMAAENPAVAESLPQAIQ